MLKSMTGYGEGCVETQGICYQVEVRSVNNRYLKTSLRVPDILNFLEEEIDKLLKESLVRGTVNYSLRIKNVAAEPMFEINEATLKMYIKQLSEAAGEAKVDLNINLANLVTLPGVVHNVEPDEEACDKMRQAVIQASRKAIDQLMAMREREGKAMADDLMSNCDQIKERVGQIRTKSPIVVKEYQEKLQKRIDDLLKEAQLNIDAQTLMREVAVFAERSDISEECTRLESHVSQFYSLCEQGESAGRRLDFLCQEMFREANTIGSKASDAQICQWVVDLKCFIDRIKEQVQNVE